MAKVNKKSEEALLELVKVEQGAIEVCLLGTTPFVANRKTVSVLRKLLLPPKPMTRGERMVNLKHDPLAECRATVYTDPDPNAPTLIRMRSVAFKDAMRSAAVDMAGASKAQMGRLTFVVGDWVPMWGTPAIWSTDVRSADMNKTPDVRTRAILSKWASRMRFRYSKPLITRDAVVNLLAGAGVFIGVGDGRQEKGKLSFGLFSLVSEDDPDFLAVVESGGRAAQQAALESPDAYDDETADLITWFVAEATRRGFHFAQPDDGFRFVTAAGLAAKRAELAQAQKEAEEAAEAAEAAPEAAPGGNGESTSETAEAPFGA